MSPFAPLAYWGMRFPPPSGFVVHRLIDLECRISIRFTSIPFSGPRPVCPPLGIPSLCSYRTLFNSAFQVAILHKV